MATACLLEASPLAEVAEWAEGYRRFWGCEATKGSTTTSNTCIRRITDDDDRP